MRSKSLSRNRIPLRHRTRDTGHGGGEIRRIKVCTVVPQGSVGHSVTGATHPQPADGTRSGLTSSASLKTSAVCSSAG